MKDKKQLLKKVIEILKDKSDNFEYRRIAALDCANRLLSILEYEGKEMNKFGDAPVQREGQPVFPDLKQEPPEVETTYVERRVPTHLEDEAHKMIDDWLTSHGYDPEEI